MEKFLSALSSNVFAPLGFIFIFLGILVVIFTTVERYTSPAVPLLVFALGLGGGIMWVLSCFIDNIIETKEVSEKAEES